MPSGSGRLASALDGGPCYVIAEAGSNHCGDLATALELVDVAAQAGADAVKFQLFTSERLYARGAGVAAYLGTQTQIEEIIRDLELPPAWLPTLAERCSAHGIDFLASGFDENAIDELDRYVAAHKVASYELTHEPLLRRVASKRKPVLLSTGAATLEEARTAVDTLRSSGAPEVVVLQCTARYPAPLETVNVRAMLTLGERLDAPVGLSDHSREPSPAPVAAVALGAVVVEKHFTLSNELAGPDHRFALEPSELVRMIADVRAVERALGSAEKHVLADEEELRSFARRSIFAVRDIALGERFSADNVAVLRCGRLDGRLPPARYDELLGRLAARAVPANTPVGDDDVAP